MGAEEDGLQSAVHIQEREVQNFPFLETRRRFRLSDAKRELLKQVEINGLMVYATYLKFAALVLLWHLDQNKSYHQKASL